MLGILGFLAVLGPLVVVHEFGHYLFARLFNVKAEVFSIGFGPRLLSKQRGETEWRLAAIPLGGYVKLLGEDPEAELSPEDRKRALQAQAPWKRFLIFFGGPLFNFLFAIFIFMVLLVIGEPQITGLVGRVVPGSEAAIAGFMSGDRVVEVNGQKIEKFREFDMIVHDNAGQNLTVRVVRREGGEPVTLNVVPSDREGYSQYGEEKMVGVIDGLSPYPRANIAGVSDPSSAAAKADIDTGDVIARVGDTEVKTWEELMLAYREQKAGPVRFGVRDVAELREKAEEGVLEEEVENATPVRDVVLTKPKLSRGLAEDFGLHSAELFVDVAVEGAPAVAAGLAHGDRMVSIDGKRVQSFFEMKDAIQAGGEKNGKVKVTWERAGERQSAVIEPTATNSKDPNLKTKTEYTIGIRPYASMALPETVTERVWNPFVLVWKGTERMVDFTWRNIVAIGKMFTGDVSVATLGGPILIGKIAGDSMARGLIDFLRIMAVLSVGLGILNVLPIPVLDGGHLLLLGIEAVRGKPLSIRQMEIIQQVGLSLILILMVIVIRNDLTRVLTN